MLNLTVKLSTKLLFAKAASYKSNSKHINLELASYMYNGPYIVNIDSVGNNYVIGKCSLLIKPCGSGKGFSQSRASEMGATGMVSTIYSRKESVVLGFNKSA